MTEMDIRRLKAVFGKYSDIAKKVYANGYSFYSADKDK